MFNFFRKIRKSIIESGKISKYLLYAIGEITLVVLGILIALQFNTWNENHKERAEESIIIISLKDDLQKNIEHLEMIIERNRKSFERRKELISIFEEYEASTTKNEIVDKYKDTIGYLFMMGANALHREELVSGTYDAIIGSGKVSIIQNKELVRQLAEYYAEIKSGFEDQESQMNFQSLLLEKTSPYLGSIWPWFNEEYDRYFYNNEKILSESVHNFLSDSSIEGILLPMSFFERFRRQRQRKILRISEELVEMVNLELEKRE